MVKTILFSFYRVKNLGTANRTNLKNSLKKARSRRGVSGIILIGDINLPNFDWEGYSSSNNIEQLFLDSFINFELDQFIRTPTHIKELKVTYLI